MSHSAVAWPPDAKGSSCMWQVSEAIHTRGLKQTGTSHCLHKVHMEHRKINRKQTERTQAPVTAASADKQKHERSRYQCGTRRLAEQIPSSSADAGD